MRPQSAKAKGRRLQQHVRDLVRERLHLQDADVESRSMGAQGSDLMLSPVARARFPYDVECKNTERPNLKGAWEQAVKRAEPGVVPLVVMSWNRNPEPVAVIPLSRLLYLESVREEWSARC